MKNEKKTKKFDIFARIIFFIMFILILMILISPFFLDKEFSLIEIVIWYLLFSPFLHIFFKISFFGVAPKYMSKLKLTVSEHSVDITS